MKPFSANFLDQHGIWPTNYTSELSVDSVTDCFENGQVASYREYMIDLGMLIIGGEIQSNEITSTPETNVEELIVLLIEHAKEPTETETGSISQQICRLIAQEVIKSVLRSVIEYGNENPNCAFLFSKVADTINSAESDPFRRRTYPFLSKSITDTMLNLYSTEIVLKRKTIDRPDDDEHLPKSKPIPDYVYGCMYQITSKILSEQNQYSRRH